MHDLLFGLATALLTGVGGGLLAYGAMLLIDRLSRRAG